MITRVVLGAEDERLKGLKKAVFEDVDLNSYFFKKEIYEDEYDDDFTKVNDYLRWNDYLSKMIATKKLKLEHDFELIIRIFYAVLVKQENSRFMLYEQKCKGKPTKYYLIRYY